MKPEEQRRPPQPYELTWVTMRSAGSVAGATAAAVEARGLALAIVALIAISDMVVAAHRRLRGSR
ncbi:hypothetical protein [Micromonospora sp. NBRC 101691]|uniref:hypothetical protein n=1 Tax=Micromonospora sp. NBRC 101691 TaxID=3032198 RepID=UPI0024A0C3B2|nr:hypothetical protein [Micromonospora sp. NBRC 101691]GLY24533.1 hypothetical protein Misp04_42650 [Micromonospora sp. NBRC 101691]